jgi:hypothetical protein
MSEGCVGSVNRRRQRFPDEEKYPAKHVFLRNEPDCFSLENSTHPTVLQRIT